MKSCPPSLCQVMRFINYLRFPFVAAIHLGDLTMKSNLELDRVRHRINNMFDSDSGVDFLKMSDKIRDQDSKKSSAHNAKSQVSFSSSASTESSEPESEFRRSSIWSRSDLGRLSSDWCFIDC